MSNISSINVIVCQIIDEFKWHVFSLFFQVRNYLLLRNILLTYSILSLLLSYTSPHIEALNTHLPCKLAFSRVAICLSATISLPCILPSLHVKHYVPPHSLSFSHPTWDFTCKRGILFHLVNRKKEKKIERK